MANVLLKNQYCFRNLSPSTTNMPYLYKQTCLMVQTFHMVKFGGFSVCITTNQVKVIHKISGFGDGRRELIKVCFFFNFRSWNTKDLYWGQGLLVSYFWRSYLFLESPQISEEVQKAAKLFIKYTTIASRKEGNIENYCTVLIHLPLPHPFFLVWV